MVFQPPRGQLLPTVHVSQFFDRLAVTSRLDRGTLKFLRRAGGALRLTVRRSIRKRKAISQPGRPPHSHEGSLRRLIFFGLDNVHESVVVGPAPRFRQSGGGGLRGASLLEFGGTTYRQERIRTTNGGRITRRTPYHYRPRPFMRPAEKLIRPRLPQMFADAYS